MSLHEYHARQMANVARNQRAETSPDLIAAQRRIREVQQHVEKAAALLGEDANPEAKAELERAVKLLAAVARMPSIS